MLKQWIALLARSDSLLKLWIASAIQLQVKSVICARKLQSLTGINELKIIIFVLYYITVLVCTKTTIQSVASGG